MLKPSVTDPQTLVLLAKGCVMGVLAFALTRTRLFPNLKERRLSLREHVGVVLLFVALGIAEVIITQPDLQGGLAETPLNLRIVAVSIAGLLAGPWVGLVVGLAITAIAIGYGLQAPMPIAISMIAAGVIGGLLHDWKPEIARRPLIGFAVGLATSFLRNGLVLVEGSRGSQTVSSVGYAALLQGLSVAMILLVIEQTQKQESDAQALAMAEVRALRARMDPHFLFNSLNTIAALSQIDPKSVPIATAHLGRFLRSSLDQDERAYVSLAEELEVVDAYLDIETLRMGERISIVRDIDSTLLPAQVPPFMLQPLVENAVCHGLAQKASGGKVTIGATRSGMQLILTVTDNGCGLSDEQKSSAFMCKTGHVHALELLRRRLDCLYARDYAFEFQSRFHHGTKVSLRIPLNGLDVGSRASSAEQHQSDDSPLRVVPRGG